MGGTNRINLATPKERAQSGPIAWPILAPPVADRFLFRRPELAYLRARAFVVKRTSNAIGNGEILTRIRKLTMRHGQKRVSQQFIMDFMHSVSGDDLEDVKRWVQSLHEILSSRLQNEPCWETRILIECVADKTVLAVFKEPWL